MPLRILTVIPARAGSRRLRHKNVRKLDGIPLLVRAITLAQESQRRGEQWRVVVTTDSPRYAQLARQAGAEAPFLRPATLAGTEHRLIDAVLHAHDQLTDPALPFDAVIMVTPTTPLTTPGDLRRVIRTFKEGGGRSVVTVAPDPYAASWRFHLAPEGHLQRSGSRRHHVGRSQEDPDRVVLNGAAYMATPDWLRRYGQFVRAGRTLAVTMPRERSVDIEDLQDLRWAEFLLRGGRM